MGGRVCSLSKSGGLEGGVLLPCICQKWLVKIFCLNGHVGVTRDVIFGPRTNQIAGNLNYQYPETGLVLMTFRK